MPELPDVEVFRRYLDATSLHRRIGAVRIGTMEVVSTSAKKLHAVLDGRTLERSERRGKWLFAETDGSDWLVLHFGMTGYLSFFHDDHSPEHVALELDFDDGAKLAFVNVRKLGRVDVTASPERFAEDHDLGPDALTIEREAFVEALAGRRATVKGAIMDQSTLAGVGNIYADEILFQAGVDPRSRVSHLSEDVLREVWRVMRRVLRTAISHQAEPADLPRGYLLRTREAGAACPGDCAGKIQKITVSGRPTYLCGSCQKRG